MDNMKKSIQAINAEKVKLKAVERGLASVL